MTQVRSKGGKVFTTAYTEKGAQLIQCFCLRFKVGVVLVYVLGGFCLKLWIVLVFVYGFWTYAAAGICLSADKFSSTRRWYLVQSWWCVRNPQPVCRQAGYPLNAVWRVSMKILVLVNFRCVEWHRSSFFQSVVADYWQPFKIFLFF